MEYGPQMITPKELSDYASKKPSIRQLLAFSPLFRREMPIPVMSSTSILTRLRLHQSQPCHAGSSSYNQPFAAAVLTITSDGVTTRVSSDWLYTVHAAQPSYRLRPRPLPHVPHNLQSFDALKIAWNHTVSYVRSQCYLALVYSTSDVSGDCSEVLRATRFQQQLWTQHGIALANHRRTATSDIRLSPSYCPRQQHPRQVPQSSPSFSKFHKIDAPDTGPVAIPSTYIIVVDFADKFFDESSVLLDCCSMFHRAETSGESNGSHWEMHAWPTTRYKGLMSTAFGGGVEGSGREASRILMKESEGTRL
ncbi:hypothetical protein AC579_5283 [Pseudocercospora musae]|uniref:Uncharacterized protein n=1 Tax=Pseudocercospora musae TaxID=113226 RepID=A0A139IPM8_9PEZI|nr:hypothetical protein AC579_5283 [Pseudocercospora musae]